MKDKKAIRKNIIILIIIIVGATAIWVLYPIIQLSMFYIFTPKSELQIKVEKYIEEYNRSCAADKQVKLDNYYEGGPGVNGDLKFIGNMTDDNSIVDFFIGFHNDFGYDNFCNKETNAEFFRKYNEVYFQFENIRMTYGDEIPLPMEAQTEREYIDATIHGIYNKTDFDPETIGNFRGNVYAF